MRYILLLLLTIPFSGAADAKSLAERFVEEKDYLPVVRSGNREAMPDLTRITVEKQACQFPGDAYTYSIDADGSVVFDGEPGNLSIPPFAGKMGDDGIAGVSHDMAAVTTLFNFMASSGIHTFSANFESSMGTQCETFVSVTYRGGSNLIRVLGTDVPVQIDVLFQLAQNVVRAANFDR